MDNHIKHIAGRLATLAVLTAALTGCTRDIDSETPVPYPAIADVYTDGFASDMDFQAWGKSTNFHIDTQTKHSGYSSIRIEVPGPDDPQGSWAGGNLFSKSGRDLTSYDALVFYAKSSTPTTLEAGFGNAVDNTDYLVGVSGIKLNSNWQEYIIPIPNAAKLTKEKGLFYYSAGMVNNEGYSIWIDDVKFVKLGTLAHPRISSSAHAAFPGVTHLGNLTERINLPDGKDCTMTVSPKYFTFVSSAPEVASVEGDKVMIKKPGEAVLTALEAEGNISLSALTPAPDPTRPAADVISLLSNAYESKITANWNPYWQWSTAEYAEVPKGNGHAAEYTGLNFVGIVFNSTADCSAMNYLHMDVMSLDEVGDGAEFKAEVHNGQSQVTQTIHPADTPAFKKGQWVSLDIPLAELGDNKQINQLVLACGGISHVILDNIYFYK